ncbi:MAG: glycosyltransferase [Lachnospiraceae bacterium]|nr:MAG: glycosyltransferase [Lachnospiraceae bacterium]
MSISLLYISMMMPRKNANNGGANTFYYYISNMAKQSNVVVTLIAKARDKKEASTNIENVRIFPIVNKKLNLAHPISLFKDINSKINPLAKKGNTLRESIYVQILDTITESGIYPDVIILEFSQMAYLVKPLKKKFPKAKFFVSEHDVTYLWYKRKSASQNSFIVKEYWNIIGKYRKKMELNAINQCDIIMPHNDKDKKLLIEDGIDPHKVCPIVPYYEEINISRNPNYRDVIIYGAMDRPENYISAIWFIKKVMPLLTDEDIRLLVIGGNPSEKLHSFESNNIKIMGFVENLKPYFSSCVAMVAPLSLGAGIKIKVLEAMYAGIPTLTNEIGIEGIPAIDKRDYFLCNTPEEYAEILKQIIDRKVDLNAISKNAHKCIVDNFDKEQSFKEYYSRIVKLSGKS